MKLIIEGDYKKVKQLLKELTPRCKKDKVSIEIAVPKEEKKTIRKRVSKK